MRISSVMLRFPEHCLVHPLPCHTPIYSIFTQQQFVNKLFLYHLWGL